MIQDIPSWGRMLPTANSSRVMIVCTSAISEDSRVERPDRMPIGANELGNAVTKVDTNAIAANILRANMVAK